jgi:hypothetical protein
LFVLGIPPPVCSGELVEFETIFRDLSGKLYMRSLTHIDESGSRELSKIGKVLIHWILKLSYIRIEADYNFSLSLEFIDHLNLVDLTECLEKITSIGNGEGKRTKLLSFTNNGFHLLFDIFEFGFFKSNITEVDIIIPTGIDIRSDCKFAVSTHDHASGLCHDVGEGVTASREWGGHIRGR